jgi:hypothetical protein
LIALIIILTVNILRSYDFVILLMIPVILLFMVVLMHGLKAGKMYTKWGLYTGKWFIDRHENPVAFWGYFFLYFAIIIILIISSILYMLIKY